MWLRSNRTTPSKLLTYFAHNLWYNTPVPFRVPVKVLRFRVLLRSFRAYPRHWRRMIVGIRGYFKKVCTV